MAASEQAQGPHVWPVAALTSILSAVAYYPLLLAAWSLPGPAAMTTSLITSAVAGGLASFLPAAALADAGRAPGRSARAAAAVGALVAPSGLVLEYLTEGMYGLPGLLTLAAAPWAGLLLLVVTGRIVLRPVSAVALALALALVLALLSGMVNGGGPPGPEPSLQLDGIG